MDHCHDIWKVASDQKPSNTTGFGIISRLDLGVTQGTLAVSHLIWRGGESKRLF